MSRSRPGLILLCPRASDETEGPAWEANVAANAHDLVDLAMRGVIDEDDARFFQEKLGDA
jgi:hypothetical protein